MNKELLESILGEWYDFDGIEKVDNKKIHDTVFFPEAYVDRDNNFLISFKARDPRTLDRILYYIGAENEAEMVYFNRENGLLVFELEYERTEMV